MNVIEAKSQFAKRITEINKNRDLVIPMGNIPAELYSPSHAYMKMEARQQQIDATKATIVPIAKELFKDTALITPGKQFSQEDIDTIFTFFDRVKPFVDHNIRPDYWDHITAAYARAAALTEALYPDNKQTQYLFQVRLLFHDIGRLFDAEDYRLNDKLADEFFEEVGISKKITKGMLPLDRILELDQPSVTSRKNYDPKDRTNNKHIMILDIADNFGRIEPTTGFFKTDETIWGYMTSSPNRNPLKFFAEQRTGVTAFYGDEGKVHQQYVEIVRDGIEQIKKELRKKGSSWEQCAKRAQEIFTARKVQQQVETTLKESPIHTVVFDLGDVVFGADDEELFTYVTNYLQRSVPRPFGPPFTVEEVTQACVSEFDLGMTADSDEKKLEFLNAFYKKLKIPQFNSTDHIDIASLPFQNPNLYKRREEMVQLINYLLHETNLNIVIISDMIAPVQPAVEEFLKHIPALYDDTFKSRVRRNFSPDLGVAKRSEGNGAFAKVLAHIPEDQLQGCVFIDDKEKYVQKAQDFGIRAIQFRNDISTMASILLNAFKKLR